MTPLPATDAALVAEARWRAAVAVNADLTLLYWQVGDHIHREILGSRRADYCEEIVSTLRRQLSWTRIKALIHVDDAIKHESIERARARVLDDKGDGDA